MANGSGDPPSGDQDSGVLSRVVEVPALA